MKLEDMTLKQIKEICIKHRHGLLCGGKCPILIECNIFFRECPCGWLDKELKREVSE